MGFLGAMFVGVFVLFVPIAGNLLGFIFLRVPFSGAGYLGVGLLRVGLPWAGLLGTGPLDAVL